MKVFLSYGHDHNREIVEKIRDDLKVAGYDHVWFDNERIVPSDDWRRAILDGLKGSGWVLGFLSKHSVRDPGVCLDELAIALHDKAGAIATILLEGEAEPPVSVSHIQWLDMHDWKARKAEGAAAWEAWYKKKFAEILKILASPSNQRFAGEIEKLERLLKPVSQQARAASLIEGFVGREWLLKRLDDWRRTSLDSRLLWISGAAGTGKSAFAAWLAHFGRVNVIGLNLCEYNKDDLRDARRVIRTLAFQMATRLPDYRRFLLDRFKTLDPKAKELKSRTAASAFSWLLTEPLRFAIDGGRRAERFLVVIDGLDETVRDGRSDLAEVLAEQARHLPEWLALVVTGRPEEAISQQFDEFNPVEIEARSPENLDDLRRYLAEWLGAEAAASADPKALVERIVQASDGNFLYVRMLREAVTQKTMRLDAPEGLPKGLSGLYGRWFRHRFPAGAYKPYRPVIEVIVAAETPVPEPWLKRIFGWSKVDEARMLEGLGSLFEQRGGGIAPFHKSLRDWLIDRKKAGAAFVVDEAEGSKALVDALWPAFLAWAGEADHGTLDAFIVAELPAQMMRLCLDDVRTRLADCADVSLLWPVFYEVAGSLAKAYAWERALAWWGLTARLAEAADEKAVQAYSLTETGDILVTLGRSDAALKSFRAGLAIRERLAAADEGNAGWQRDISVSFDRVGDVLVQQGNLPEALKSFRAGLAIRERLAAADEGNAGWQRDLSVSFNKVGDVLVQQGNLPEALKSFRAGLAVRERLAAADEGNAGWQRDISVSFDRVGDVLVQQGNLPEALKSFRAGLAIAERLATADEGNAGWQRDISVSFDRVGDVLVQQGNLPEALKSFRAGLAIRERLAAADEGNAGWQRDLSVSFNRIGDALIRQGKLPEALTRFRAGLAIAERLAAADEGNAGWQRDLSVSFNKVGDVLVQQGNLPEALKSFRAGLAIAERLAAADEGNAGWQRDISVSFDRVGDVLVQQGNLPEALKSFRAGLAIRERLAAADEGNAGWQRDLSVSFNRIGDALIRQGKLPEALTRFRAGLAIAERLAAADEGNAGWQRDLSVSFNRIGDALIRQGKLPEALKSFRAGLAIAERLAAADEGNAGWQRDISVSFDRVGDVLVQQGNLPEALKSFRAGLAIRERLAAADEGNAGWQRDLIVSCVKIAGTFPSEARAMLTRALNIAVRLRDEGRLAPVDAWMPDDLARRLAALP